MASDEPKATPHPQHGITRRHLLEGTTVVGVAGALMGAVEANASAAPAGQGDGHAAPDTQFAHEIRESCIFALAGENLDEKRMKTMRALLETNLKEIELMRQFDPDEEEPVTRFRPW